MINKRFTLLKILFYISIIPCGLLFITLFNPSIGGDEPFTMALIHHSFFNMLHLSYFDVHPPLYYIVLKFFLNITTFWTKSVLIKIIFARVLSLFCLLITFLSLSRILNLFSIHVNRITLLISYLILTPTIGFSVQIRMYEMATALLSVELLLLIRFMFTNRWGYLLLATISASIASYTHYFAAMFAGSMLLAFMIQMFLKHDNRKAIKVLFSGILFSIMFIPCLNFAHRQLLYAASSGYENDVNISRNHISLQIIESISGMNFLGYTSAIIGIILVVSMIYFTIMAYKNNVSIKPILSILIITFLISLCPPVVFQFFGSSIIEGRYFYPLVSIYDFLLIGGVILHTLSVHQHVKEMFINMVSLIIILCSIGDMGKSVLSYQRIDVPSYHNYCTVKYLKSTDKIIHLKDTMGKKQIPDLSIYSENDKRIYHHIITKNVNSHFVLASNNKKLLYDVFSNIEY